LRGVPSGMHGSGDISLEIFEEKRKTGLRLHAFLAIYEGLCPIKKHAIAVNYQTISLKASSKAMDVFFLGAHACLSKYYSIELRKFKLKFQKVIKM
jgi:hypothetical protein